MRKHRQTAVISMTPREEKFFIGSTETEHAYVDAYSPIIGRIELRWRAKCCADAYSEFLTMSAHSDKATKDAIIDAIQRIDAKAKEMTQ